MKKGLANFECPYLETITKLVLNTVFAAIKSRILCIWNRNGKIIQEKFRKGKMRTGKFVFWLTCSEINVLKVRIKWKQVKAKYMN